jgi:CheY-like chemotaxis protein
VPEQAALEIYPLVGKTLIVDDNVQFNANVLLVEDNPVNQEVATAMLENLGCTVTLVGNGVEALDTMAQHSFDLIFMDCQMPVMDGYTATEKVRESERNALVSSTPRIIIALTANAMLGDRERCIAAGIDDYLPKPFTQLQLSAVMARWIGPLESPRQQDALILPAVNGYSEQAPQGINPQVLDDIRNLQCDDMPNVLTKAIDSYLKSSAEILASMEGCLESSSIPGIISAAHTLKSSSAMLGSNALYELCQDMEQLCVNDDLLAAQAVFLEIQKNYQVFTDYLAKLR